MLQCTYMRRSIHESADLEPRDSILLEGDILSNILAKPFWERAGLDSAGGCNNARSAATPGEADSSGIVECSLGDKVFGAIGLTSSTKYKSSADCVVSSE